MAASNGHAGEEPRNPHVHHEIGDVNARALTKFGMTMTALITIFMFGLYGMFQYLKNREAEAGLPKSPSALVNAQKLPPQPRLQAYPRRDMTEFKADEQRILGQYALIDPDKGVVRIPVDRAMDLIAQRGLPATPSVKATAPAAKALAPVVPIGK
jgi:hypothetical protein